MIALSLAQIADIVGGDLVDVSAADAAVLHVTGTVEFDSRAVTAGGLFLALPGARSDGHAHAPAAVAAGAVAVLAARPVGVPAIVVAPAAGESDSGAGVLEHDHDGSGAAVLDALARLAAAVAAELVADGLTIVGVTGSSGKTSTKDLLAAVLAPLGEVVAPPGSFNNELGHPWTVLRATTDTDYLVLELSARHPGNIAALAAIAPPSIGVVLNVGTAHLGEFGSREAIAATKSELPQAVPASGVVVLNADDPVVEAMADKTSARVVRVGRWSGADVCPALDVWAGDVMLDELARPRFTLHAGGAVRAVALAVHGEHQVSNALCAAAVALECGATLEQVTSALDAAGPASRHRMAVHTRADGVTVVNDAYNANPDSMRAGLRALAWMAGGQERSDRGIGTGGQERSDRGIGTGGQERSDRGIGTGGQERSDRGIGTGGQERSDRGIGTGGQERSDRGIGTGGQERSDRGIGTGGQERSDRGIGTGGQERGDSRRRSWAVLGEMAELGDDAIAEHDSIGRLVVRLDVSRLVVVGSGRSLSAMHAGAVMEGSWGREAVLVPDAAAALELLRAEIRPGDVILVKASNSAGLAVLADALASGGDPA